MEKKNYFMRKKVFRADTLWNTQRASKLFYFFLFLSVSCLSSGCVYWDASARVSRVCSTVWMLLCAPRAKAAIDPHSLLECRRGFPAGFCRLTIEYPTTTTTLVSNLIFSSSSFFALQVNLSSPRPSQNPKYHGDVRSLGWIGRGGAGCRWSVFSALLQHKGRRLRPVQF